LALTHAVACGSLHMGTRALPAGELDFAALDVVGAGQRGDDPEGGGFEVRGRRGRMNELLVIKRIFATLVRI